MSRTVHIGRSFSVPAGPAVHTEAQEAERMTEPTEPAPGAPGAPPAPPAPPAFDPSTLPPEAQAYLKAQVDAADLKARVGSKANAAAAARTELTAQVAKALGLAGGEPATPEQLMQQAEAARDAAWSAGLQLQIYRTTGDPAVADRLLDSRSFIDSLDDLAELDPNSEEFRTQLAAKVQEAAAKFTTTGTTPPPAPGAPVGPRPDPSQGPRGQAPTARPTSLTQAYNAHYANKQR